MKPANDSRISAELLERYLNGSVEEDERTQVEGWLAGSEKRQGIVAALQVPAESVSEDVTAHWLNHVLENADTVQSKPRHRHVFRYVGIAAVVIICIFGIKQISKIIPQSKPSVDTYTTAPAQRATFTLRDGSRVTLAPATTIQVTGRNVDLTGEAMFIVSHNTGSPFTVRSGTTTVRVLGTTFGVRRYADENVARIAVAEGRVAIGESTLNSGDLATVTANGTAQVQHDAERVLTWLAFSQGTLAIDVQTLAESAPQLSRWLGLDVRVESNVAGRRLKATLKGTSATAVLDEIAELTETTYTRDGRKIVFKDK